MMYEILNRAGIVVYSGEADSTEAAELVAEGYRHDFPEDDFRVIV